MSHEGESLWQMLTESREESGKFLKEMLEQVTNKVMKKDCIEVRQRLGNTLWTADQARAGTLRVEAGSFSKEKILCIFPNVGPEVTGPQHTVPAGAAAAASALGRRSEQMSSTHTVMRKAKCRAVLLHETPKV